ncbi:ferredoxin family protein [Ferroplasma acidiphilum]|nr:4Fe-4S dicluster domain-containing protein [Candidatus Thermoplasmatota archaeon]
MMDLIKRLGLNKNEVGNQSHIEVNTDMCKICVDKPCIKVCPAGTYEEDKENGISVHYERCLECGAALYACPFGALQFKYPEKGVSYIYG